MRAGATCGAGPRGRRRPGQDVFQPGGVGADQAAFTAAEKSVLCGANQRAK